jgi:TonB family protein
MFASLRIKALSPHAEFSQHLGERHFLMMVCCAIIVHTVVLLVFNFLPRDEVLQIPVRSLNIKFGGSGTGSMVQTPNIGVAEVKQAPAVAPATAPAQPQIAEMKIESSAAMKTLENVISEAPSEMPSEVPLERTLPKPMASKDKSKTQQQVAKALPTQTLPNVKPQPISEETVRAAEQLPSEYVRTGQLGGDNFGVKDGKSGGVGIGNKDATGEVGSAEVLRRYEQVISLWIQRNKVYPASAKAKGLQGQAVVRIRINREGTIIFSRLDKPTAYPELNEAITQMIRASNPVPAVPSNYPAGNLFEFLIPVSFRLE